MRAMSPAGAHRLIDAVPLAVALTIGIAGPIGFLADELWDQSRSLQFTATLGASQVARFIYTHPTLWQYQGLHLSELIHLPNAYPVQQSVRDRQGRVVVEEGPPVEGLALREAAPIVVAGNEVGSFVAATRLAPVLWSVAMVTLLNWLLAGLAFLAVRGLPIRALNRALDQLARQKSLFEAALDNMSQGLCMLDSHRHIVVANRRLLEMFGLDGAAALVGRTPAEVADLLARHGPLGDVLCRLIALPPEATAPEASQTDLPDGRTLSIDRRGLERGGWLITVQDITDRVRAQRAEQRAEKLHQRAQQALEVSRAKSMFLATMSHEIRTPMNGVLGLASSLLEGELTDEQRQVIGTIRDSGDSLMQILNDILEFSKLEGNALALEHVPFSPAGLAASVESVLGQHARSKGLVMRVTADPDLPPALLGDPGRLRQVLMNLVSNAIKFTPHGEIAVHTRRLEVTDQAATLEWFVRDSGIGIEPETLERLFHEFTQADGSINRRFGGSGLGLVICRRLVERMGGTIAVESTPGVGSTFRFRLTLPCASSAAPAPAKRNGVAGLKAWLEGRQGRPRILVAEDDPINRFVLDRMLTNLHIGFDAVGNGLEAVHAAGQRRYDAICMDCQMPVMDGLAATRAIRARGGWLAEMPIVALTGDAFADNRQACAEAGMTEFLAKPMTVQALAEVLLRALAAGEPAAAERAPAAVEPV